MFDLDLVVGGFKYSPTLDFGVTPKSLDGDDDVELGAVELAFPI